MRLVTQAFTPWRPRFILWPVPFGETQALRRDPTEAVEAISLYVKTRAPLAFPQGAGSCEKAMAGSLPHNFVMRASFARWQSGFGGSQEGVGLFSSGFLFKRHRKVGDLSGSSLDCQLACRAAHFVEFEAFFFWDFSAPFIPFHLLFFFPFF